MRNVEVMVLAGGNDYRLKLADGNVAAGQSLEVIFSGQADDLLVFNGAKETDGDFIFELTTKMQLYGGRGDDSVYASGVNVFNECRMGLGYDLGAFTLAAQSDFKHADLEGFEELRPTGPGDFHMVLGDRITAPGAVLLINPFNVTSLFVDGRAEKDGMLQLDGSAGDDTLRGGHNADSISGSEGMDSITGLGGADQLTGGSGNNSFIYLSVGDSTHKTHDVITDLKHFDHIDLTAVDANIGKAGDQAFHQVSSLSGHAGELVVRYDADIDATIISGDVDGDGKADLEIVILGDQHDFSGILM
jgi:Ca2+-binding RTX toxin-like protein